MKRIILAFLCPLLLTFNCLNTNAQDTKKETIAKVLTDYFFLDRENIHVQSNKSIYMANEQIWFKGYVFHRKKNLPFFTTINVFANLIDDTGKIVDTQLIYANIGSFTGNFKLNSSFRSGKYYLQFYTNWMNNFIEDESAINEITIINTTKGNGNVFAGPDPSKINIEINPEGGTMLSETANILGISVSDCNHNATTVKSVDITDANGKPVQTIQINKLGYGRITLPANTGTGYKAIVNIDGIKHEQAFPVPQIKGVALEVNDFSAPDKTIITLSTNKVTFNSFGGKPLYVVIHKDEDATIYEVSFNSSLVSKLTINNADIPEGMNTIRVLDGDLNPLAERLIYRYPTATLSTTFNETGQTIETLAYQGKVNYANMNLSISILPEDTRSYDTTNDIYSSFLLLPYIDTYKKASGKYYFTTLTKAKSYELDLFLLSQKSKYSWHNIVKNPPKSTYTFDMGLVLKGAVPKLAGPTQFAKVRLYSLTSGIDEVTDVDEKGNFTFNNLLVPDSTYVNFTLLKKSEKPKELTLAPQLLNANKKFARNFLPTPYCYNTIASGTASYNAAPNVEKGTVELEEVKIEARKLKYANIMGNGNLRGYKISEMQANMYQNLLNFIKTYGGFDVNESVGNVTIYGRGVTSVNGGRSSPIIYIDNIMALDFSMLAQIQMSEVDEIYMNAHAIVPSVRNNIGVIRIYLNKGAKPVNKNTTPTIILKNGYSKILPFKNVGYLSTQNEGFVNFGVISWIPNVMTDENGAFKFDIPKTGQKNIKLFIEGFSADGKLISETKTITVK
ncbi:hypothetical protein Q765_05775 [Flavobacterium rivuli WB 3.3-2 = DSM 21788]|uniref:TonB-dependent receptor plug domain-containing protein n=1 Tax=Flavobacterium rivuli WB 3.3-2 = DSM 21788 TaxID=1121895 RepID=A0A0A2M878_9FLAO|nr:hypothetical protein [Flavobacterium rivuli]KGO87638.1 hypothetical protein Q765_05775 [Flavobacterium rivuli WB 3.3-2 = DSM 21788]